MTITPKSIAAVNQDSFHLYISDQSNYFSKSRRKRWFKNSILNKSTTRDLIL